MRFRKGSGARFRKGSGEVPERFRSEGSGEVPEQGSGEVPEGFRSKVPERFRRAGARFWRGSGARFRRGSGARCSGEVRSGFRRAGARFWRGSGARFRSEEVLERFRSKVPARFQKVVSCPDPTSSNAGPFTPKVPTLLMYMQELSSWPSGPSRESSWQARNPCSLARCLKRRWAFLMSPTIEKGLSFLSIAFRSSCFFSRAPGALNLSRHFIRWFTLTPWVASWISRFLSFSSSSTITANAAIAVFSPKRSLKVSGLIFSMSPSSISSEVPERFRSRRRESLLSGAGESSARRRLASLLGKAVPRRREGCLPAPGKGHIHSLSKKNV